MQIEIYIDGENKLFITPFVPLLAKRKYYEIMARSEKKYEENKNYVQPFSEQLKEETELAGVLANVVFNGEFTVEQLFEGTSDQYFYEKLGEAVFGKKKEGKEGNMKGE